MPTQAERTAARLARLDALERTYEPRVRVAIIRTCEAAADAAAAGATPAVAAALVRNGFLVAVLSDLYVAAGLPEALDEYEYLTTTYPRKAQAPADVASGWAARLRRFISTEGATSIRSITETVRKKVRKVLTAAADAGLGVREAAAKLREEVAGFSRERAVLICRTELVSASNFGSYLGAEATGLRLNKFWIATTGGRTRATHAAANGQVQALDQPFSVGGFPARYPGDPLLPARERARCRCTQGYRPRE